ncbi:ABC transporter permease [Glycomyces sp. TRM65418]|uniref:ABC transporter permease n=1 Tax=Glycomyces sp. TRM65418 TaxID=2867006 RepID=UPI001CE6F800|nr:ABC transporter permease [Glycomyces sp. TRM65418]MCC3765856.1 ABC transporter permease [Glycomyces sp. TRM65418]QZD55441.1 ABC transporter permease [Glycomyces sp. TRM65418]
MTAIEIPPARRPGPRAWAELILAEGKMVVRDTAGLLIPLGMPLLILVMNGLGSAGATTADGVSVFERYVMPVVFTIVIATVGVVNMPSFLAYYRRSHVLRRLAVTPANPGMILAAQLVVSLIQSAVGVAIGMAAAMLFFDVGVPERAGTALAVFALAALTMYAIGMLVAAIAPTGNAAVAIGLALFFALGATGGMFGPTENLPEPLARIGEALPFGAAVQAVGRAWAGADQNPAHLLALAAAAVLSTAVAVKCFRWE